MSDDPQNGPHTNTLLHIQPPASGSIVHGVTAQMAIDGALVIGEVDWTRAIKAQIAEQLKLQKSVGAAATQAANARDDRARKIPVPADLLRDMGAVATAMTKFHAGAVVADSDGQTVAVDYNRHTFTAVALVRAGSTSLFTATRSYPLPDDLEALNQAWLDAQVRVAKVERNLKILGDELSAAPERVREMKAEVVRAGLQKDAVGQEALRAMAMVTEKVDANLKAMLEKI